MKERTMNSIYLQVIFFFALFSVAQETPAQLQEWILTPEERSYSVDEMRTLQGEFDHVEWVSELQVWYVRNTTKRGLKETIWRSMKSVEELPETVLFLDTLPDDPCFPIQWSLESIGASVLWQLVPDQFIWPEHAVPLAIVDEGTDTTWEDLSLIAINHAEIAENGIDDDSNGYIDDFFGWNSAEDTPDPFVTENTHGVRVSKVAVSRGNNGVGQVSPGYEIPYLPLQITTNEGEISDPYRGVLYAVTRGAKVINASWGQTVASSFARDVVEYAESKGCIIVAAAGNHGDNSVNYPAAFSSVVSVGAHDEEGKRMDISAFGSTVDVYAPGKNITLGFPQFVCLPSSGTSLSCALVSSTIALFRGVYPDIEPQTIRNRLNGYSPKILHPMEQPRPFHVSALFSLPSQEKEIIITSQKDAWLVSFPFESTFDRVDLVNSYGKRLETLSISGEQEFQLAYPKTRGLYLLVFHSKSTRKSQWISNLFH